jgi:transposase InsO family protein
LDIYKKGGLHGLCRKPSTIAASKQCSALEQRIITHRQENPTHGVRRIRDNMHMYEALEVSAEKVRQTVNNAGLGNPAPKSHKRPPQIRRFERSVPNAMWQIDIFTFELKRMYKAYLIGIIDDHSRYLAGWGLYRQQTAESVMEVVKGTIGQWGAPREILSDNGRQFVAWRGQTKFQKTLKQQGIQHVRSAPQHPMTLGKIERFWQTIWREFLEEASFASFADACQRLDHWMAFYNHQRPHQGIDGACPADRFYGMAKDKEAALAHGCQENSLRLALGQEPQSPLYLLGQLGGTDVRVVRKGDDIEIKVGDAVHEVIHLATPYAIQEDGHAIREPSPVKVEEPGRSAEVSGSGTCPQGRDVDNGAVSDVRDQSPDAVPCDGHGRHGSDESVEPETKGSSPYYTYRERDAGSSGAEQGSGSEPETPANEERSSDGPSGTTPESGSRGEASRRKKNESVVRRNGHEWL